MAATKEQLRELQAVTGTRLYPDGPNGLEIHCDGEVVAVFSNKGQAAEWLAGAAWMKRKLGEQARAAE